MAIREVLHCVLLNCHLYELLKNPSGFLFLVSKFSNLSIMFAIFKMKLVKTGYYLSVCASPSLAWALLSLIWAQFSPFGQLFPALGALLFAIPVQCSVTRQLLCRLYSNFTEQFSGFIIL